MKKRIKLTENQFTSLVRLNEELTNDPITKQYNLIDKRLASIWVKLSDLSVQDIFNMSSELNSLKDEADAMLDKMNVISSESERLLAKIETEFGRQEMYTYDSHYTKLNNKVSMKIYAMFDFIESLISVAKHIKLEKMFPPVNI
jgi:hypothetical protein